MEKPYTVVLEEEDMDKLKIKAVKEKTTVKKLMAEAVKKILEGK
jgi:hypothetical protein